MVTSGKTMCKTKQWEVLAEIANNEDNHKTTARPRKGERKGDKDLEKSRTKELNTWNGQKGGAINWITEQKASN